MRGSTALDVGANVGSKAEILRGLGARVVAVEPDPDMAAQLRRRFAGDPEVTVEQCAVGAEEGSLVLRKYVGAEAFNTASDEWAQHLAAPSGRFGAALGTPVSITVPATTLSKLLARFGPVRFLKVDVEGLEWKVLSTLVEPVAVIALEFNLPQFMAELVRCVEHLARLDPDYRFNAVITEPPQRFALDSWLEQRAFLDELTARGWGYAEVYARREASP